MAERVEAALRIICVVLRPRAGEHDAARRLALSRAWPPHRARDRDLPFHPPVRRQVDRGLDTLLELCDSRITYRQRYVMVAARAPVIDLTMLDPSNPRSVGFQFDQIEPISTRCPICGPTAGCRCRARCDGDRRRAAHRGRRRRPDDKLIVATEIALMNLSEATRQPISASNESSRPGRTAGMIYDVRQTTTYSYASRRPMPSTSCASCRSPGRASGSPRRCSTSIRRRPTARGTDFFENRTTVIEIEEPHEHLTVKLAARVAVEPAPAIDLEAPRLGRGSATAASQAKISVPRSPVHFIYPSRQVPLDAAIRDYAAMSFAPPDGRSCGRRRTDAADQGGLRLQARRHDGDGRCRALPSRCGAACARISPMS